MDTVTISKTPAEGQETTAPKFKSLAEATASYAELESSTQQLLDEAEAKASQAQDKLSEAESKVSQLEKDLNDATAKVAALENNISELEKKAQTAEESSERKAAEIAASVKVEPVQIGGPTGDNSGKLTRSEFEAKSFADRIAFIKAGGKVE